MRCEYLVTAHLVLHAKYEAWASRVLLDAIKQGMGEPDYHKIVPKSIGRTVHDMLCDMCYSSALWYCRLVEETTTSSVEVCTY